MDTSDYIAISALLVSLIIAGISIRSWRFNVKVKSLELRALLLASLHNALVKAENVLADYAYCKDTVLNAKQIELFKQFTKEEELHNFVDNLRNEIKLVEAVSGYRAVDLYHRSISRITGVSLRIDDVSNDITTLKTNIMTALLTQKGKVEEPSHAAAAGN